MTPLLIRSNLDKTVSKSSQTATNLGATFDTTVSLDNNITTTIKTCKFQLRSIDQAREYLSKSAVEKVRHAFMSSKMDNRNSLLYDLPDYQIKRLQRVQ